MRKTWLAVLIGACGVAGLLAFQASRSAADDEGGPGAISPYPNSYGWANSFAVGKVFTDGLNMVEVEGGPITILSVRPQIEGTTIEYLGARILGLDRPIGGYTQAEGFPPTVSDLAGSAPAEGMVLTPAGPPGYELLIGYRVTGAGRTTIQGVDVEYQSGSAKRKIFIPSYVAICSPVTTIECPTEYG